MVVGLSEKYGSKDYYISDVVQAQELRPSDSRMLVALGESYEKLDKV